LLSLYNTYSRTKEKFEALNPPFVGIYLCGPTVYSEPHLGHARGPITFDVLRRYMQHLGYTVRFVRNITDVGHLEDEVAGTGEDRITKKARLERKEPMEVAQQYTNSYRDAMRLLNVLPPSIEPQASGHIMEQIEVIEKIIAAGWAYIVNGSVYFDVKKYAATHDYGRLSGRVLDELLAGAREGLEAQDDKQFAADFALWKRAEPTHIMRWQSPWGVGFPGWHIECTAMSTKYLGEQFDIHGGGLDLQFPHHECEIAQSQAALNKQPARYWMHNNMITIDGQKMARSLGNFITLNEFFTGNHPKLTDSYSYMTLRFFILQAHYRSTTDFSNEALQASNKGYKRLMQGLQTLKKLQPNSPTTSIDPKTPIQNCYDALNDDLNTPIAIANLYEIIHQTHLINDNKAQINTNDLVFMQTQAQVIVEILGLTDETNQANNASDTDQLMQLILEMRTTARENKDFATSDKIRNALHAAGFEIKDGKDGANWQKI
jgi:cysteinyl-tRNA synthetase